MDTPWMEQELLAHAAWVRELARGLVGDEEGAEDLAQDTFVVALRGTPRERASMRAWLAGIARRLAWKRHRDRRREFPLDEVALHPASTSSPQSIEQLELHELLARELRALREPLRATLIERFIRGRSAAEIAQQSGVPLATVRSRLQLGLEELRSRLDRKFEGDRETWMSGLTLAAGSKGAVLGGGLLVSTLGKVCMGLAAVVVGVLLARPLLERGEAPARGEPLQVQAEHAVLSATPGENETEASPQDPRTVQPGATTAASASAGPPRVVLHGRCVDLDGSAVGEVDVALTELSCLSRLLPNDPRAAEYLVRTRSSSDGNFTLATKAPEPTSGVVVAVEARKHGFARGYVRTGDAHTTELDLGDIRLGPGTRAAGVVRDALGKRCEAVELWIRAGGTDANPAFSDHALSDGDGAFAFENAPAGACMVDARAQDLRKGRLEVDLSSGEPRLDLEIVLPELAGPDSISGRVVDPAGVPVPKAWLLEQQTTGAGLRLNTTTACDEHGCFRIDGRPDSTFEIVARDREGSWGAVRMTDVHSGTHGVVLQLDAAHTFLLRVRDALGQPIERFSVERRTHSWIWQRTESGPTMHGQGELRLPSDIEPFELHLRAPGWRERSLGPLDPATLTEVVEAVLERACVLRGSVRSGGKPLAGATVSVVESRLDDPAQAAPGGNSPKVSVNTDKEGRFELTLEGTGGVRLQAARIGEVSPITDPIAIRPGSDVENLVLELVRGGSIEGRILDSEGRAAAKLVVVAKRDGWAAPTVYTDAEGRFRVLSLSAGRYQLSVSTRHGGMQFETGDPPRAGEPQRWTCDVQTGVPTRVDLRLLEYARLLVALDLPRVPTGKWLLGLWSSTAASSGRDLDERESSGRETVEFEFTEPFDANLSLNCHQPSWPIFAVERRAVERGTHALSLSATCGRIEGTLSAPFASREQINLSWQSGVVTATAQALTDASGHFVFECAPAGECTIQRGSAGGASKKALVRAGETARLDGL